MLNAPLPLHRRSPWIPDSDRFMNEAAALLKQSRAFVACEKARAVARTRASVTDEEPLKLYEAQSDVGASRTPSSRQGGNHGTANSFDDFDY